MDFEGRGNTEQAYSDMSHSDLVELLKETVYQLEAQKTRNEHIHKDREYLQKRWDEEVGRREHWTARFDALVDLLVDADRGNNVALARAREGEL